MFLCHDYKAPNRDAFVWETTIGAERTGNVHVHSDVSEDDFVLMREARFKAPAVPGPAPVSAVAASAPKK